MHEIDPMEITWLVRQPQEHELYLVEFDFTLVQLKKLIHTNFPRQENKLFFSE